LVRGQAFEHHDYCEYLLPKGAIGRGLPQTEHAMYRRGMAIQAADAEVLAPMVGSLFDRTYRHFSSHRQTPSSGKQVQPGIVRKGSWILHLLHFIPERRSDALDVIEDVIPLFNVKVGVKAAAPICEVTVVPEEAPLNFRAEEAYTVFKVERIHGHAMISLTFG
jgi:hypothetical protein